MRLKEGAKMRAWMSFLNLIGGLDRPTAGRVLLKGQEITSLSRARLAELRLRKIGFVFQAYNLIPALTALENVEYVMLLQGVPLRERRRALAVLKGDAAAAVLAAIWPAWRAVRLEPVEAIRYV